MRPEAGDQEGSLTRQRRAAWKPEEIRGSSQRSGAGEKLRAEPPLWPLVPGGCPSPFPPSPPSGAGRAPPTPGPAAPAAAATGNHPEQREQRRKQRAPQLETAQGSSPRPRCRPRESSEPACGLAEPAAPRWPPGPRGPRSPQHGGRGLPRALQGPVLINHLTPGTPKQALSPRPPLSWKRRLPGYSGCSFLLPVSAPSLFPSVTLCLSLSPSYQV